MCHIRGLKFSGQLPLPLVPPILEPDFHLGLGEPERSGETGSLRGREIALQVERALQLEHLRPGEYCPRLLLALYAIRLATVDADLHVVLAAIIVAVATATAAAATPARRGTVKARRGGFAFAVGVCTIVRFAEIIVNLVAARRTPSTVQTIVAVIVVELVCAKKYTRLEFPLLCTFSVYL